MNYIPMSFEFLSPINRQRSLTLIEKSGRVCYKSDSSYTEETGSIFVKSIMKRGHLSVIEHIAVTVKIICNRGITHELVRHRVASYSQESTRYCDYSNDKKFDGQLNVIQLPVEYFDKEEIRNEFNKAFIDAEGHYKKLRSLGVPAQIACNVLPINTKAEIVISANLREWLHIFRMRCAIDAHPQMREIMLKIQEAFIKELPEIYGKG